MPVTSWTNPTPGTSLGVWGTLVNTILNAIKTGLNALELAYGAIADNDDATAVAAKMPGIMGGRRLVLEPELDEGALYLMGVEDTEIVNVFLADDFGRAPYFWIQNAGGAGANDRWSLFRNILGVPNQQWDIYGNERRNGRCTFVWDGPPGNMLSFADSSQELFDGSRSATLGTWQPAAGSCTLALHAESPGVTTPAGSFSSIRATATGTTVFAVTSTGVFGYPAVAGATYSAVGGVRRNGATARNAQMGIQWFDSGGAFISQAYGGTVATTQGAWVVPNSGGLVAPVGTAYASPIYQIASAAAETFDLAAVALYAGTETVFAPPFVGSGTYGTWGQAATGDGWVRKSTGEAWVCTTGGSPWLQVWRKAPTRIATTNPVALGAAAPGTTGEASDAGHAHPTTGLLLTSNLSSATPASVAPAGGAGASSDTARADHVHGDPALWHRVSTGEEVLHRHDVTTSAGLVSGTVYLGYFRARLSQTVTQLRTGVDGTGSSGLTLAKMGVYSVDGSGNLTLVGSTASDTTLWNSAFTAYTRSLSASFAATAGTLYAVALLAVGTGMPTLRGVQLSDFDADLAPRLAGRLAGQTDLPGSIAVGSVSGTDRIYQGYVLP